jgi:hypothetical protein
MNWLLQDQLLTWCVFGMLLHECIALIRHGTVSCRLAAVWTLLSCLKLAGCGLLLMQVKQQDDKKISPQSGATRMPITQAITQAVPGCTTSRKTRLGYIYC